MTSDRNLGIGVLLGEFGDSGHHLRTQERVRVEETLVHLTTGAALVRSLPKIEIRHPVLDRAGATEGNDDELLSILAADARFHQSRVRTDE